MCSEFLAGTTNYEPITHNFLMLKDIKNGSLTKLLIILLIIAVGIYLFDIAWGILGNYADVFVVVISAWLLSFMLEPVAEGICKFTRVPKLVGAIGAYVFFAGIFAVTIFLLLPTITEQVNSLSEIVPKQIQDAPPFIRRWIEGFTNSLENVFDYVPQVTQGIFLSILVFIISFYFIVDKERINKEIYSLTPKKWHEEIAFLQQVITKVFGAFLRVQLVFGILAGLTTWIVMFIFQVNYITTSSFLAGFLAIIPLIGPFLSIIPPVMVAYIEDPTKALFVGLAILAIQQVIFNVIGPKLFGNAFKIHPVIVLLSFLVGYKIAGTIGVIFAVPVLGIITLVIKELSIHYFLPGEKPTTK